KKTRCTGRTFSPVTVGAVDIEVSHRSVIQGLTLILIVDEGWMVILSREPLQFAHFGPMSQLVFFPGLVLQVIVQVLGLDSNWS
ncbi:hypothetical protein, partial [Christiangramia aquimixticola]|uniref:hypothetical protein n=1 Tax=Christiangramia aquimixticola TaxID=1697558 RepID=UPI003AA94CA1